MATEDLSRAYISTVVGGDIWMRPEQAQTVEDFQEVVAAAEAWEAIRRIEILEIREENQSGRRLIEAVRFRRLR